MNLHQDIQKVQFASNAVKDNVPLKEVHARQEIE